MIDFQPRPWALVLLCTLSAVAASDSLAREVAFVKKVNPGALQAQLTAAGIKVSWIQCSLDRCKIFMPDTEKGDPLPVVNRYEYVDSRDVFKKRLALIRLLHKKWDDKSISVTEKDTLINALVEQAKADGLLAVPGSAQ